MPPRKHNLPHNALLGQVQVIFEHSCGANQLTLEGGGLGGGGVRADHLRGSSRLAVGGLGLLGAAVNAHDAHALLGGAGGGGHAAGAGGHGGAEGHHFSGLWGENRV